MDHSINFIRFVFILIVFLLEFLFSSICFVEAADHGNWSFYGKSQDGNIYYFKIYKTNLSGVISVWHYRTVTEDEKKEKINSLKIYDTKKISEYRKYSYCISRIEIDCKQKLNRVQENVFYDKTGKRIDHNTFESEWKSITSLSVDEKLYQKVCSPDNDPPIQNPNYKNNWAKYNLSHCRVAYAYNK